MNKLQKLNRELAKLTRVFEAASAVIKSDKIAVIRKCVIGCPACHTASQLKKWGFIRNYWYTRPHGDSEGDTWSPSDTKVCHLICPHCGESIYIYNHNQRDRIVDIVDNQGVSKDEIFATVWKKHGDNAAKQTYPAS